MQKNLVSEDQRIFLKRCYKSTFILIVAYFPVIAAIYFLVSELDLIGEGGSARDLLMYVTLFFALPLVFCMLAMAMYAVRYICYLWKEVSAWTAIYAAVVSAGTGMFTGYCWFYLEEIRERKLEKKRKEEQKKTFKLDFVGQFRNALALSATLLILSIGSLLFQGLNFYIPARGEVWLETSYSEPVELDSIQLSLQNFDFEKVQVEYLDAETKDLVVIKIKPDKGYAIEPDSPRTFIVSRPKESNLTDTELLVIQTLRGSGQEPELRRVDRYVSTGLKVLDYPIPIFGTLFLFVLVLFGLYLAGTGFSCGFRFVLGEVIVFTHAAIIVLGFLSLTQIRLDHFVLTALFMAIGWVGSFGSRTLRRTCSDLRQSTENYAAAINSSINRSISRTSSLWLIFPLVVALMLLLERGIFCFGRILSRVHHHRLFLYFHSKRLAATVAYWRASQISVRLISIFRAHGGASPTGEVRVFFNTNHCCLLWA